VHAVQIGAITANSKISIFVVQQFMDDIEQMEKDLKLKKITAKYIGEAHEEKN